MSAAKDFNYKQTPDSQLSPPAEQKRTTHLDEEQARKELDQAIRSSDETLAEISTVFQMPTIKLTLDRAKIGASKHSFLSNSGVFSLPVGDILNVSAEVGRFLGSVKVEERILGGDDTHEFGPFWRKDALKFAAIGQGYVIALKRGIDINPLPTKELKSKLKELGKDEGVDYEGI